MTKRRGDANTSDLFDWQPPEVVKRYAADRVRACSIKDTVARAVAEALAECGRDRREIAAGMSEFLGEKVTVNMVNAYASQARGDHTISYVRLLALVHATGDIRLLQMGAEMFDHVVAHEKYMDFIRLGMDAERREEARDYFENIDKDFRLSLHKVKRAGK